MFKSDSVIKIAPALLAAQKNIGAAKKDSQNPFFHSTYADLGAVMEVCKEELNKNGISVLQPVGTDEGGVYVETILLHESGEFISDKMRLAIKEENNPQAQGSAITYARRYGLQSMVFIPAEDDDAERATDRSGAITTAGERLVAKRNDEKAMQENCMHQTFSIKVSHSTNNPDKQFKSCNQCGKFMGWVKEGEVDPVLGF